MNENPYISNKYIINTMAKEERLNLKHSLLNQEVNIILVEDYGLFTEHGFPVAIAAFWKKRSLDMPQTFKAKIIKTSPMVTIDELPKI